MPIVINGSGTITGLSNDSLSGNLVDGGTVSAFASIGIDDNATSTAITVDSAENIGIGTTSPSALLTVQGSGESVIRHNDAGGTGRFTLGLSGTSTKLMTYQAGDSIVFSTGGSGAERLKIDSAGNMGLGVTPDPGFSGCKALDIGSVGGIFYEANYGGLHESWNVYTANGSTYNYKTTSYATDYEQINGTHKWKVAPSGSADAAISWTTVLTMQNNGTAYFDTKLGVGTTTMSGSLNVSSSDTSGYAFKLNCARASGSSGRLIDFHENTSGFGNPMGSITSNGGGVAYNTSSDYRLKENLVPLTDSIERVKSLKPYRFNFLAEPDVTVDGFVAHEVAETSCPEAVSGEKDAMRMEEYEITPAVEEVRDDDGNITVEAVDAVMGEREVIDPQGIDQAKLVPLLTAALQTALSQIEDLTARIESLEAQ